MFASPAVGLPTPLAAKPWSIILALLTLVGCFELPPPLPEESAANGGATYQGGGGQGGVGGTGGSAPAGPLPVCGPGELPERGSCARIESLTLGTGNSCARASDGTTWCWGDNALGQLAHETLGAFAGPIAVTSLADTPGFSLGRDHGCLSRRGAVTCWGANNYGQLARSGGGSVLPVPVALGQPALAVTTHTETNCAQHTASLSCWGFLHDGQGWQGEGQGAWTSQPYTIAGLEDITSIDEVAVGTFHSCAAVRVGRIQELRCWGYDGEGAVGTVETTSTASAVTVTGDFSTPIRQVDAGAANTCLLDADRRVFCWGGMALQIGQQGVDTIYDLPTEMDVGSKSVASLAVGFRHACLLYQDGTVGCLGKSYLGALGMLGTVASPTPMMIAGLDDVEAIAGTWQHVCALRATGEVVCWGANEAGQVDPSSIGEDAIAAPRVVTFPAPG